MTSITEQVGRVVGARYRLLVPIGSGASSQVFAAIDTRLGRRVAVKVLHPNLARDMAFLRRFAAEARLAASLDHPSVMRVFDWGEERPGPYLVLELLMGGSLRSMLDTGVRLSQQQVAAFGAEAASGLAYAHRRGIIHRDIKPGNLLFDEEGHVRIADFGVARAIAQAAVTEPRGTMFGTARYASPEQARGGSLDDRTDVYSLALVCYEALTGRVPFAADTVPETLMARLDARLPPARELGPLAPILAAAAIAEPLARLDAAGLSEELSQLSRQLDPPEPLPLARVELGAGAAAIPDRDPSELDPGHPSRTDRLGPVASETVMSPEELVSGLTAMGVAATEALPAAGSLLFAPPAQVAAPLERARPEPRRRRRRPWRIALVVLAVLVLAGAIAIGVVRFGIYGHVVPALKGDSGGTARALVRAEGLKFRVGATSYETGVRRGDVVSQSPRSGSRVKKGTLVTVVVSKGPAPVRVPDVLGMAAKAATARLRAGHLVPVTAHAYSETAPVGSVAAESPGHGAGLRPYGSRVVLEISKGPHPRLIPDLYALPLQRAEADLAARQLGHHVASSQFSTTVPAGDVISESPSSDTWVKRGRVVSLVESLGQPYVTIPNLQHELVTTAEKRLVALGLQVDLYGPRSGVVVYESPNAGQSVRRGSTVTLAAI